MRRGRRQVVGRSVSDRLRPPSPWTESNKKIPFFQEEEETKWWAFGLRSDETRGQFVFLFLAPLETMAQSKEKDKRADDEWKGKQEGTRVPPSSKGWHDTIRRKMTRTAMAISRQLGRWKKWMSGSRWQRRSSFIHNHKMIQFLSFPYSAVDSGLSFSLPAPDLFFFIALARLSPSRRKNKATVHRCSATTHISSKETGAPSVRPFLFILLESYRLLLLLLLLIRPPV